MRTAGKFLKIIGIAIVFTIAFVLNTLAESKELKILFTHDIHDYLYPTTTVEKAGVIEHGGAAKLATLVKENSDENTLYLDAGDYSMGTLYQTVYSTDAYELRNLGMSGCDVTTFGNHEFDYGDTGLASMLRAAKASGDKLPQIVCSNFDFSGSLTEEQKDLKAALEEYGVKEYTIIEKAGYKVGIFGLEGYDSIDCIQAEVSFTDYIETAKEIVSKLQAEGCDIIVALSHAGTDGDDASKGEDIVLAKKVDGIDLIVSGHSHSKTTEPIIVNNTVIVSAGEYLQNLGCISLTKSAGKVRVKGFELLPVNSSVKDDKEAVKRLETYKSHIEKTILAGEGYLFDEVIAHSNYDFISVNDMYATHQEYDIGDLIADSYIYEAKKNGIDDIDVALVGLGTIRGSIKKGNVTVADAFEICSLGVGSDGSSGHPIASAYITGEELKLLTELDASLGPMVSSIKMSYSGLKYTFYPRKFILDQVTDVCLVDEDGNEIAIENDKLYKVCANMYAVNMLGMLNSLTKGALKIVPKDADGVPIENFYDYSLRDVKGNEIKEWMAFADYLQSFEVGDNKYPEIPAKYVEGLGRKNVITGFSFKDLMVQGRAANIMPTIEIVVFAIVGLTLLFARYKKKEKEE